MSCRVQLQPLSNTPETANISILETFRQVFRAKLELNSAGHRPSRTEFKNGNMLILFYTYVACYL